MNAGPCDFWTALDPVARPGGLELTRQLLDLAARPELGGLKPSSRPGGALVADMGCGAGATLELLRERGFQAMGLDARPWTARSEGLVLIRADLAALPLREGALDAVIAECVLELLPDPDAGLRDFARVTRPGGLCLVSGLCAAPPASRGERFAAAGWRVLHTEDHTARMKTLAARLVWAGRGHLLDKLRRLCPANTAYGLWIARKEAA